MNKNSRCFDIIILVLIVLEVLYSLLQGGFVNLGAPSFVRLFTDVLLIAVCFLFVIKIYRHEVTLKWSCTWTIIACFFLYASVSACLNHLSFIYYLAAIRNWFHGLIFLVLCTYLLTVKTFNIAVRYLKIVHVINFFYVIPQYFVLKNSLPDFFGDYVTGIFTDYGATNAFMCMLLPLLLIEILERKSFKGWDIFFLVSSMIVAALEEIKIYYFEFGLFVVGLLAIYLMLHKLDLYFTVRFIVVMALVLVFGMALLGIVYPQHLKYITSIDNYKEYTERSRKAFAISRIHPFKEINEMFFRDNLKLRLFGAGFGRSFELSTKFFYSCHVKLIFECGIIGFSLYCLIYVTVALKVILNWIKNKSLGKYEILTLAMVGFSLLVLCYESTLYKEAVYPVMLAMSLGFSKYYNGEVL